MIFATISRNSTTISDYTQRRLQQSHLLRDMAMSKESGRRKQVDN